MSLLTLIREEAIATNVQTAGEAYKHITAGMRKDARTGITQGIYRVEEFSAVEANAAVQALKLQGFDAHFNDESRFLVWVSWLPKPTR